VTRSDLQSDTSLSFAIATVGLRGEGAVSAHTATKEGKLGSAPQEHATFPQREKRGKCLLPTALGGKKEGEGGQNILTPAGRGKER